MNTNENFLRKLALSITHYAYRNTELEDYHSENVVMDMDFYQTIFKIVDSKIENVKKYTKYLTLGLYVSEEERESVSEYVRHLDFNCRYGSGWDQAKLLDEIPENTDYTQYILSGEFLKACKSNFELDDDAMCKINKDIHNRIFTLLVKGYFD